jgi:hypothetical protein
MQTVAPVEASPLSHAVYHQIASALHRQIHLTREQAPQIMKSWLQCVTCLPQAPEGANPQAFHLESCGRWMALRVPCFGQQCCVHV